MIDNEIIKLHDNIFSGTDIYNYPFTDNIKNFIIINPIYAYILEEHQFQFLIKHISNKGLTEIFIETIILDDNLFKSENIIKYDINIFSYKEYKEAYLKQINHNIFWLDKNEGISLSMDGFAMIGGKKDFVEKFIQETKRYEKQVYDFIFEWDGNKKGNWVYDLIKNKSFYNKNLLITLDVELLKRQNEVDNYNNK